MNSLLLYSLSVLLVSLIIYKQRKCWYFIWQLNGWRGLLQQPILWLLLIINLEPKSIMSSIQRCHKYFQFPLAIIVFNRILLYVDDPETMESILTAPECLNKTFLQNGFYANKGLLHAKDDQWKMRRKQLNPAFSHNTLVGFYEVFNRVANELKLKLTDEVHNYNVKFKNLEDLVTRAVLEVSCLTTMGFETNFTQNDKKGIAQAYRYLMELTALRILKPWYQIDFIFRLLDKENFNKSKRANKLVDAFVANIVQQKHTEWQHRLDKANITERRRRNGCAILTNRAKDESPLNEQTENHNFTGTTAAAANDALQNMEEEILSLPDTDALMQEQQKQRIFIDQIFYLAQSGKLTLQDIMNESQSMVVVSFETVSTCIINALLCLAINHECQMKLRHEIKRTLSKEKSKNRTKLTTTTTTASIKHNKDTTSSNVMFTNVTDADLDFDKTTDTDCDGDVNNGGGFNVSGNNNDHDVQVTMEHLLNMPYLDMIINESLRLLTTVPMNLRSVSADFQLKVLQRDKYIGNNKSSNNSNSNTNKFTTGYNCHPRRYVVVPKGTMLALDTFNMQRNELYWGKNALKFYPEHFLKKHQQHQQEKEERQQQLNETSSTASRHPYAFVPFSKGLRTCIGYRYSIYLSKIVLIKLISSFEFSTNIQLKDLQCYEGVSLKFRNAEKINFQIHPVG